LNYTRIPLEAKIIIDPFPRTGLMAN